MRPDPAKHALKSYFKTEAYRAGFAVARVAPASLPSRTSEYLSAFVAAGHHGDMEWIAETQDRRKSPNALWSEAKTVLVLGFNYGPDEDPLIATRVPGVGAISVYARGRDYHDVIKGKLKELAGKLARYGQNLGLNLNLKVFVDTAPVLEKPIAQIAGIGWQGKHTNLVSREYGSWLFLCEIFIDIEIPIDHSEDDHCGTCRNCLDVCPTNAFPAPYTLDARRCISYLTIEHKGPIPREFRRAIGNRIYGCDDCLAVCPWNKFASIGNELKLAARNDLRRPAVCDLLLLNDAEFRIFFSGSPIKRIGRNRFIRNVLIAVGNSGDAKTHLRLLLPLISDPSVLVRGAAIWALQQLDIDLFQDLRATHRPTETEPDVIAEWDADDCLRG